MGTVTSDRYLFARDLLVAARDRMEREDGERLGTRFLRVATQFGRNQALARGALPLSLRAHHRRTGRSPPMTSLGMFGIGGHLSRIKPTRPTSRCIGSRSTS